MLYLNQKVKDLKLKILHIFYFLHLYETKNVVMQVEGSDQWGNITTGIDLINKKLGKEVHAFTMPLILDSNGNKFGKSEVMLCGLIKIKHQVISYINI